MAQPTPNPSGCCDLPVCCNGRPVARTLIATITALTDCSCANGVDIPIRWNGKYDEVGTAVWISDLVDFGTCLNPVPPPTFNKFILGLTCVASGNCAYKLVMTGDCGGFTINAPDSCSGCPNGAFSLVYTFTGLETCCRNMPPPLSRIQITITEG